GHAAGLPVERGEHVEAGQGGAAPGEPPLHVLLDRHRAGQEPQPQPHARPVAERAVMLLADGERFLHVISPPATAIAWPVIAWLSGRLSHSTAAATSAGVTS